MYEFHPYFTNDGSVGLYNPEFNDIYHSAEGALTEAYEKFILPVNFDSLMQRSEVKVLDICYGIGYNSKSFLNFVFENYFQKNFSKIHPHSKDYIDTVYTNNIFVKLFNKSACKNNKCNDKIYTNNILPKISITAVDNDEILSFLSPFIKTGVTNFKNKNLDFEYKNIEKYLQNKNKSSKKKINNIINFLIFEKMLKNRPDFLLNNDVYYILKNKQYSKYFDSNLRGIFEYYKYKACDLSSTTSNLPFLHNIYYRNVSRWYKNRLKTYQLQDINFDLKNMDARKAILDDKNKYNLIFLDAFTPSKCPCLWSYEFFVELYNHLEDDGMILSYSTSASIRGAMLEAGFSIGNIYNERKNKFTGTIAVKNKLLIKYPLSEFDLGLIKTRAGIFYRDKHLTALNEAIIEARNLEVKNSNRISSSQYQKHHKEAQCTMM